MQKAIDMVTLDEMFAAMADAAAMADWDDVPLVADVAELMHCIGRFWTAMHYDVGNSQLERLFGFPIRRYDEGTPRERVEAFMSHHRAMADSSQDAWHRASKRLDREYRPREEACARIWLPVYEYLLSRELTSILPCGWSVPAAKCLPPGRPTSPQRRAP